ncbi:hypothetical protein HMPREF1991_02644 [Hoylesella loescheii DSM 19665 = JCM 12249 = ATCC 15930]|uniref:Uncharacterized protein n=1 Tax=Hoylesella loescheii DSM 19665 = JCM 12249 = ATCC 15930 TaxID=1122985 RepID=A0A069QER0_HOYLO|nr:hypothetical protein HMPREF1991_02644 [Hoylesella loescheii DSM 19665 = JCM 12249 = ATCC 15930]
MDVAQTDNGDAVVLLFVVILLTLAFLEGVSKGWCICKVVLRALTMINHKEGEVT